jgi:hypothetical protein
LGVVPVNAIQMDTGYKAELDSPIDWDYFDQWLQRLGLNEPWHEIKSAIESMIGRAFK